MTRIIAMIYSGVAALALVFGWWGAIALRNVATEHLLPGIVLFVVTLPTSFGLELLYFLWPSAFQLPFFEHVFMTICAAIQPAALWALARKTETVTTSMTSR